jgi:carboxypeptidase PM20D1
MRNKVVFFLGIAVFLQCSFYASFGASRDSTFHPFLPEFVKILQEYIQIPSETGYEYEAGKFFSEKCEELGLHVFRFSTETNKYNFAASLYPLDKRKPNIILLNHIDVVPAGDEYLWRYGPYDGVIDSSHVYGRGAIDMKGQAIMQLAAIMSLKSQLPYGDLPYNVTLLAVSGEEDGGKNGAQFVTRNFLEFLNPVVVLGEGGGGMTNILSSKPDKVLFGVSIAEKMSLWLKLTLEIESGGHGATPSLDYANLRIINALSKLNNRKVRLKFHRSTRLMFKKLGKEEGGIRGFFIRNINWTIIAPFVRNQMKGDPLYQSLLTNTITVTNIANPPGPPNFVSARSEVYLDCRLIPGQSKRAFIRQIKNWLDDEMIIVEEIDSSPEVESTKPDVFFDVLSDAIISVYPESSVLPFMFPATTDNSYFRALDIPTYGLIPAVVTEEYINLVHASNERISFEMLSSGIKIYEAFLHNVQNISLEKKLFPLLDRRHH